VGGDLFGVILAVAPVNRFMARQGSGMQFAFGHRDQVEAATRVAPTGQTSAYSSIAGQPATRRDVADTEADAAMGGLVRRAGDNPPNRIGPEPPRRALSRSATQNPPHCGVSNHLWRGLEASAVLLLQNTPAAAAKRR
jgi:hypothetical protein